jgi:hypothetical protein
MKYYAGIGSRNTPLEIRLLMTSCARKLAQKGYTLRSGGARGADQAFASGAKLVNGTMEIWDPRKQNVEIHSWAVQEISKHCHEFPYARMKPFIQQLLGRNMYQILGEQGDKPVSMVLCWTPTLDASDKGAGGTRYAVRCALAHNIPIWNLRDPLQLAKVQKWLDKQQ